MNVETVNEFIYSQDPDNICLGLLLLGEASQTGEMSIESIRSLLDWQRIGEKRARDWIFTYGWDTGYKDWSRWMDDDRYNWRYISRRNHKTNTWWVF